VEDQFKDSIQDEAQRVLASPVLCHLSDRPGRLRLLDILGEDNVMWGSDYPHPDGIWPDSQEFLDRELAGVTAEARRKITRDNAMKLYRLSN